MVWFNAHLQLISRMEGGMLGDGGGRQLEKGEGGKKRKEEERRDDRWRERRWMEGGMVEKVWQREKINAC